VGAGNLDPAAAVAEEAKQALKARRGGAGAGVGAAHVIDHDGTADRFQNRDGVGQILDVDPELQVPAEFGHDRRQRLGRVERHAAAVVQRAVAEEMVEAQSAHPGRMPAPQLCRRRLGIGHRDAAQPVGMARERIEHRRVVAPMGAALHQHAARKADRVEHR
jgi:hypothetical protein